MHPVPIYTAHLFPILEEHLIDLLLGLSQEDWQKPTVAKLWNVKDVAAHLLDTAIRRISIQRDQLSPVTPKNKIDSYEALVVHLNTLNAEWVTAYKRVSPQVIIEMTRVVSPALCNLISNLDPNAQALFPVSWAGESGSVNWFDIAREFTERWLHQQQIRFAVNKPKIETAQLFHPVINTWMRALPYAYRNIEAQVGTVVQVDIEGEAGGSWQIIKEHSLWQTNINYGLPSAAVTIPQHIAWQLFSKSMPPSVAKQFVKAHGKGALWAPALEMVSVMA